MSETITAVSAPPRDPRYVPGESLCGTERDITFGKQKRCSIFAPKEALQQISNGFRMEQVKEAYKRLLKGDAKYRFVIDMASLT